MRAQLPLGRVVATPGALKLLTEAGGHPFDYLARHATGDWESCAPSTVARTRSPCARATRSSAPTPIGRERVWVITEADRSITTILLPEEY